MKRLAAWITALVMALCITSAVSAERSTWYCPTCGAKCNSNFCPNDATPCPFDEDTKTAPDTRSVFTPGQRVYFGRYEQDNNSWNGDEAIEWIVLAVENDEALLISRYGLDLHLFHPYSANVKWENCELRSWLNSTFLQRAFTSGEQGALVWRSIPNDARTGYEFPAIDNPHPQYGGSTTDRIFLLSYSETQRYFSGPSSLQCRPTAYAAAKGAKVMSNGYCWWWLRSPGYTYNMAMGINSEGVRVPGDQHVDNNGKNTGMVRPAMWVNMSRCMDWTGD